MMVVLTVRELSAIINVSIIIYKASFLDT